MWEYKEVFTKYRPIIVEELNKLGNDRWEMSGCIIGTFLDNYNISNLKYIYYFKRQILE